MHWITAGQIVGGAAILSTPCLYLANTELLCVGMGEADYKPWLSANRKLAHLARFKHNRRVSILKRCESGDWLDERVALFSIVEARTGWIAEHSPTLGIDPGSGLDGSRRRNQRRVSLTDSDLPIAG